MGAWDNLSIREKADIMKAAIRNGITTLPEIKQAYNEFAEGGDTVGEWVDAIYQNNPKEEFLGEPEHHYDFTQSEEWADAHGYYPDARGHRDDRVKKPAHPSHPSRGTWEGDKFVLSELGMQNPNYTLFGLNDGGQDPQAVLTYQGGSIIPEITATPNGNYIYNPYDNIRLKYSEGGNLYGNGGQKKSGGSFYQTHKARWNDYLLRHGVPAEQAARLSGFFSAQDALESGHGTSSAARQKNNFGGMQRLDKKTNKMVNISYPSVDAYMDAKWKMMRSRFGRALNAKTAQEYSDSLNNPKYHGKGYMYALYEGYRDGQPLDVARQTKHMNNYTKALMSIAGEKGFKASPVPAGSQSQEVEAPASIARPENPYLQFVPFTPFNPQAFGAPQAFVAPTREEFEIKQPIVEAANDYAYSPEQLEKEERRQGLDNLSFILGMMNGGNGSSFADTIGMLTGNIAAKGGPIHIKPENRGKFTALKERTGHSATWFKEHGTPAQKKMATFALNARHWKHGDGGNLYLFGGDDDNNPRPITTGGAGYIPPVVDDPVAQTRKYLYRHILPISDYNIKETINGALEGEFEYRKRNEPKFDYEKEYPKNTDYTTIGGTKAPLSVVDGIWADYLQIPQKDRKKFVGPTIQQSKYKPSSGGRSDVNYYALPLTGGAKSLLVKEGMGLPIGKNKVTDTLEKYGNTVFNLGDHTIGRGKDNKGDYISYYDVFDLNPFSDKYNGTDIPLLNKLNDASFGIGKPVHIYDRIYLDDYYGVPSPYRGGYYLPEVTITGRKRRGKKHGYGGHIYDGLTEDDQQMNAPYAGELPDVTVMPRRIANKSWDKVQERWVGDMPTYYAVNPETGKEEMLREIGNGKYSTYDDKHVFDVLGAEAAKKEREQWVRNGGNASDFDKVMLGTLGLGLAPIALPEAATGIWAASQTPTGQTLLAGTLGGEAWEALNHGITGQSWGDNLGDVIGLDKDNYLGRTALGLTNPFYFTSPSMIYKGGAAATELGKSMWNAGKEGLQYTAKAADNAVRGMSPSYDLYRTIGETPVSRGSLQKSLTEDFGIFEGPKRVTFFDTPYRQRLDDSFNLVKESAEAPKQYGMRFAGKYGDSPEVLGKDGMWYGDIAYFKNKKFSDPIDNSIIVGKESRYRPEDYLFHYDRGNYPVYYNTDGTPMLHRLPDWTEDLGPIWWNKNSKWGDRSVVSPRLIKAPDYGKYRQPLSGDNIGDSDAILTGDYPLGDAEFLERDDLVGTMGRGIFAQQPTPKTIETPTIEWAEAVKSPQITAENESVQNESIKNMFRRILRGKPDDIKITKEMAEMGRKDLLDEISSPWYKERWKKATNGNDEQIDDLLSRMRARITDVPMDYSKTTEQLSGKPGFATYGATVPREPYKFTLSDGTPVTDYNTGLDVQIASDRGVEAQSTAYHELQHYLTNKATGTASYPSLKFIANGPYEPLITPTSDGELLIGRGDAWQHFIMDQNEALLPERSFVYEEAVHSPQKLKKRLVEIGRTPEEADDLVLKLKDEAQDMMYIQEERAHLKTWFTKDILPLLKNPNDASEIERVLTEHPDIMKNRPEKIKTLMESLRPGSVKDYAKYLAESLGIVPFIVNTNSKEK